MAQRVIVMHKGEPVLDGCPEEVFQNVDLLHEISLAAPDTVELCRELNKAGYDLPLDRLDTESCAQALYELLKP